MNAQQTWPVSEPRSCCAFHLRQKLPNLSEISISKV